MEIIVDLFAGGGGASHGIYMATGRHPDAAVNHDPVAVAMDKLAGDVTAAVGDRMRAEGEAQILATWLANRELGISPTELRESARKEAQGEMEARHE